MVVAAARAEEAGAAEAAAPAASERRTGVAAWLDTTVAADGPVRMGVAEASAWLTTRRQSRISTRFIFRIGMGLSPPLTNNQSLYCGDDYSAPELLCAQSKTIVSLASRLLSAKTESAAKCRPCG